MTLWTTILLAAIVVLATKVAGHTVPTSVLERPTPKRTLELLTVALLACLVAVQTIADGAALRVDARIPAVVLAGVLFWLRVPFVVVVIAAAVTAALLRRFAGLP